MKKIYLLVALYFLTQFVSDAQKQTNHWYFGLNAGLDFTSGTGVAVTNGALNTAEGCSAISTPTGQLLFYTDGIAVFDDLHDTMPNSGDLDGNISSTQSALIVPQPDSSNLYYIFTCDADGGAFGFRYSIVDLRLNGGHGDVAVKNIPLISSSTEKVTAVMAADSSSYWVMAHEWGSDAFYAYLLSSTGLSTVPVISYVGSVHNTSVIQNTYGQMKFSPDATKLAAAIDYQSIIELFDFDDATGVVSNPMTITNSERDYGLEFSADGSKLYITRYSVFYDMYYIDQFDLSSGDSLSIVTSQYIVASSDLDAYRALQLGLDGKIYVAKAYNGFLGLINSPNSLGAACNFDGFGVDLQGESGALGLPGFVQSWLRKPAPPHAVFTSGDTTICANACISFTSYTQGADSWQWFFQGAHPSASTDENPQSICYTDTGYYDVELIVSNSGGTDTALVSALIHVVAAPPTPVIILAGDTLVSSTDSSYTSYQWFLDSVPITDATNYYYIISESGNYNMAVTNANGCKISVGINILGLNTAKADKLNIYPNPAYNQLFIFQPADAKEAEIYNVFGQCVMNITLTGTKPQVIDISGLSQGVYFLQADSKRAIGKFVKE